MAWHFYVGLLYICFPMNRLHNLDYLRGLAAFSIMIYHYCGLITGNHYSADTILGRLGIYGVSIFYILSGLTLYLVYQKRINVQDFAIKRIFRIFPLLWLAILATIMVTFKIPESRKLVLNATGLFGFIDPGAYIGMGMWSIGNELVFYVFFPVFMYLINKKSLLFNIFSALLLAVYSVFAFRLLNASNSLAEQWGTYINPLNQVFLFASGVALGHTFQRMRVNNKAILLLLLASVALFVFYPADGDSINLVTGWNRIVFTTIVFLICFCFYKTTYELPQILHKPLSILGEASYSVYLLHPIVWLAMKRVLDKTGIELPLIIKLILPIVTTLIGSYMIYIYFEKYFVKVGKRVTGKVRAKVEPAL